MEKKIYEHSKVILGMMRLNPVTPENLENTIRGCIDLGIDYFDTSDVYCRHAAEEKLGQVLSRSPELRDKMFLQTKVGIIKNQDSVAYLDLSYDHIIEGVNASLKRLHTSYVDSLLLHRPDIFVDNVEVAKAIKELKQQGKIRHFGVSNMDRSLIDYLSVTLPNTIEINQLQVSLGQAGLLSGVFNVNNPDQVPLSYDGLFFYMKQKDLALQCWSPYIRGFFNGSIFTVPEMKKTQDVLKELSEKYHTTPCGIATSFLAMLGKNVQVITGSMNIDHIKETVEGSKLIMEKPDWYKLYISTDNLLP